MNFKIVKEFIIKQRCLPWRVLNLLNCHFHPIYMLIMHGRLNINSQKYWEKRFGANDYEIGENKICLYRQVASKIPVGSIVLDVGCGEGSFMEILRDSYKIKSFGIDFASAAIQTLEEKGLDGCTASATDIPFDDNTFDAVTALEVLEHLDLKSSKKALKEIRRVCKNNGLILVTVPTYNSLTPQVEPEHLRAYTKKALQEFLSLFLKEITIEPSEKDIYFVASGKIYK